MNDFNQLINERIAGKRVLITGGTTGIGRATALLLPNGAKVMIFGCHREQVDENLSEICFLDQETSYQNDALINVKKIDNSGIPGGKM